MNLVMTAGLVSLFLSPLESALRHPSLYFTQHALLDILSIGLNTSSRKRSYNAGIAPL